MVGLVSERLEGEARHVKLPVGFNYYKTLQKVGIRKKELTLICPSPSVAHLGQSGAFSESPRFCFSRILDKWS